MSRSSHSHDDSDLEKKDSSLETDLRPTNDSSVPRPITDLENGQIPPAYHVITQAGVQKVELATDARVWTRPLKIALFIGLAIVAYTYSLDGTTSWQYAAFATSSFSLHSLLGAVATAQAIIIAVAKPVAAKVSDVFGRAEAFALLVTCYVVGYAVVASSNGIHSYAAGSIIYSCGYASLQIMMQILIGDVTTIRWRTLASSLISLPFFINFGVASRIAAAINGSGGWRWGYGMFCIIIPVACAPIMGTLFFAQRKAKRLGVVATNYNAEFETARAARDTRSLAKRVLGHLIDVDALGLLLFGAGWTCVLLPITLVNRNTLTWDSGKIIAMLTVGPIILIAFVFFEGWYAPKPLFPLRFFKNKTIIACGLIGFFDFVSFYLQYTYLYSFIYITQGWSLVDQNYFAYTQTLSLTFFAIMAGAISAYTRRGKWLLVIGLAIRLLGVGLMIRSRGANGSTFELVITQVLQGMGGGIAAACTQTLAQASSPHQDLASVTAFVLLLAEIGNGVGTAIATAIWRQIMPGQLEQNLAGILNSTEIDSVYGAITTALTYAGTPAYEPIVASYTHVMKILVICATAIAVIPLGLSLLVTDLYLGDGQNAVEHNDVAAKVEDEKK